MDSANNYNIVLKTEVAAECSATVRGFIFRNYNLNHIPMPSDIEEIERRAWQYDTNNLIPFKDEETLDKILEQLKVDYAYVREHTPKPHR